MASSRKREAEFKLDRRELEEESFRGGEKQHVEDTLELAAEPPRKFIRIVRRGENGIPSSFMPPKDASPPQPEPLGLSSEAVVVVEINSSNDEDQESTSSKRRKQEEGKADHQPPEGEQTAQCVTSNEAPDVEAPRSSSSVTTEDVRSSADKTMGIAEGGDTEPIGEPKESQSGEGGGDSETAKAKEEGGASSSAFVSAFADIAKKQSADGFLASGISSGTATTATTLPPLLFPSQRKSIFDSVPLGGGNTSTSSLGQWAANDAEATADGDVSPAEGAAASSGGLATQRPVAFPGEEGEDERFVASNVALFKSVPVEVATVTGAAGANSGGAAAADGSAPSEARGGAEEQNKENGVKMPTIQMKFRKQGEGVLKVLAPKHRSLGKSASGEDTTSDSRPQPGARIVVRQKGTWGVLLNSPVAASSKFDVVEQMTSGFGVKFVGLDVLPSGDSEVEESKVKFGAFCAKFASEAQRSEFIESVKQLA